MEDLLKFNRRKFLGSTIKLAAAVGISGIPLDVFAGRDLQLLTILHTNDTHSRIDPFPANDPKFAGMGGIAERLNAIEKIRSEQQHVLLLDSGDFFQGTPYFNIFGGEIELKSMSALRYDASTLGNHDFDNGADGLAKQLIHANFPLLNSNYNFSDSELNGKIENYKIFQKGEIKVGVFGIGIELKGLVDDRFVKNIYYLNPVQSANRTAELLKKDMKCDLVICLSHLGLKYEDSKISDLKLAEQSSHIDLILGGHTHTFLDEPLIVKNSIQKNMLIAQVGWGGIKLGRIDFLFEKRTQRIRHSASTVKISTKSS
ncbi:MAG: metallophosphatase [Bacteroidetes bacterium]|nr:metallophosphatase [Bacteroidota bacterium]